MENEQRHSCIVCGKKRYQRYMKKVLHSSWACSSGYWFQTSYCYEHPEILKAENILNEIKDFKFIKKQHLFGK